jgi:phosphoesterase RecJ-like protein
VTPSAQIASDPTQVPADVLAALKGAQQVALLGHVTPDADALASMAALWLALPELGVRPHLILPADSVSRQLGFLVRYAGLEPATPPDLAACDLIVALDTAKLPRLNTFGEIDELPPVPIVNIDHHATNTQFGQYNWVVGTASSTSELVYAVLRELGCQVTPTIATLLYGGLHTDTQGFSLSNTGPNCLRVAHALAEAGANIHEVCERMHRSHSRGEFDLLGVIYRNTHVSDDGRLAWSTATYDEITQTGCTASDIDDQVEVPRSIEGICVAMLFTEGEPGKVRMNFRGEGGVSVIELAKQFGGGGHHASAGARMTASMDDALAKVIPAALAFVAALTRPERP